MRNLSFSYLEKFSPSKQQLKTYLLKKYLKYSNQKTKTRYYSFNRCGFIRFRKTKFISDKFYSESKAKNLIQKGSSINKIRNYLISKVSAISMLKRQLTKLTKIMKIKIFFCNKIV